MEKPIRIAHIIGKWVGGGVEAVVMNYYRHIDHNKIQFDFICDDDSTNIPYEEIEKLGGKVILIPPYQKIFKYQKELKKVLKKNNYQIVHSHINTLSVFPLYAAKRVGVPVRIAHSHSTTNKKEWKKNLLKQVLRPFSKLYATDYMACTEHAGRWLFGNKEYDKGNVYLLNNAIDLVKFKYNPEVRKKKRKELGVDGDTLVIGHIGRFVAQKNHSFLIDIFNEVHKVNSNSILVLAGQGPLMNEIKEKVESLGLTDFVKFLGQRNDANELYQAFDVFCLPSLYEGLGMVAIEAQVAGCYCIASTEVPVAAKVTNNIFFESLNNNINNWKEKILSVNKNNRESDINIENYDIRKEVKYLEEKYINKIQNKISFFCQRWTSGGIERIVTSIINIKKQNIKYEIVTSQKESNVFDEELNNNDVNIVVLNKKIVGNAFIRNITSYKHFKRYIKNNNIETMYINVYNSPGLIYAQIAKRCRVKKIIVHAHNNGFDNDKFRIKKIINNLSKMCFKDKSYNYIACSKEAAKFCFNKRNLGACKIIKNGINTSKYSFNKKIREEYRKQFNISDKFVIGNVGRMTEQKNQLKLIDIFIEILKINKDSILLIIGDGPLEKQIQDKIIKNEISDKVIILKKRNDVANIMQAMDVFVFPSIYEGFGIVAIEAQAAGLPTFISSNLPNEIVSTSIAYNFDLKNDTNKQIAEFIIDNSKTNRDAKIDLKELDIDYMLNEIQKKL